MIKVLGCDIDVLQFPDGTPKFSCQPPLNAHIVWKFQDVSEMFQLYCLTKHFRQHGVGHISLYMPYIPNARMDRVKNSKEVFTLKWFCDFINDLKFDCVEVLDPHSDVSAALLNNVRIFGAEEYIYRAGECVLKDVREKPVVLFPDAGAMKRYQSCVSNSGLKVAGYANKVRDWDTGQIKGLEIYGEFEHEKPVLVVDDICSYGGTFYHICKKLKECGVDNVFLYATHCENSVMKGDLINSGLFIKMYTTNSLLTETHEKIETFDLYPWWRC